MSYQGLQVLLVPPALNFMTCCVFSESLKLKELKYNQDYKKSSFEVFSFFLIGLYRFVQGTLVPFVLDPM